MKIADVKPHDEADPDTESRSPRNIAANRPVIEQAKGMVMLLCFCDAEQAFTVLREISQHTNIKLHGVAAIIVAAGSGPPAHADDDAARTVLTEMRCTGLVRPFASA